MDEGVYYIGANKGWVAVGRGVRMIDIIRASLSRSRKIVTTRVTRGTMLEEKRKKAKFFESRAKHAHSKSLQHHPSQMQTEHSNHGGEGSNGLCLQPSAACLRQLPFHY